MVRVKRANKIHDAHRLNDDFVELGDAERYRNQIELLRSAIRALETN